MEDPSDDEIIHFYNLLLTNLNKNKMQVKMNSVFITLIEATQRKALQMINESAIPAHTISPELIKRMVDQKLIKRSDQGAKYLITARGIWEVEKKKNLVNEYSLLDFFDEMHFSINFTKTGELDPREKVVILSMIAARVFSKDSSMDLSSKGGIQEKWKEIVDLSAYKLCEMGVITQKEVEKLHSRSPADPPPLGLLRRLPDLYKKISIYRIPGDLHYYLEMPESQNEFKEKLAELFSMVFSEKLSFENLDFINNFCSEISYSRSYLLFDLKSHKFSSPNYDELVKESIIKGIKEYS